MAAGNVKRLTLELGGKGPNSSSTTPTWTWPRTARCSAA